MTRHELRIALKAQHGFWQYTGCIRRCVCGFQHRATSAFRAWPAERKHMLEHLNKLNTTRKVA